MAPQFELDVRGSRYHFASSVAQAPSSQPHQILVEHLPPTHSSLAM